jgi:AcrR family transcriptional regulator
MNYIAERRQEEKERRRAEILDAAEAVSADAGWDELTMDLVARRARLSRALLYVYFKDKVDLMYGICERGLSALRQQLEEAAGSHGAGLEQVLAMTRTYVRFSQDFPVYFDIMARCSLREVKTADAPENELACNAVGDALGAHIVTLITAGMRDGSIRSDLRPVVAASALWGFTQGVIQLAFTRRAVLEHHGVDASVMLDQAMSMMARSLAAKP